MGYPILLRNVVVDANNDAIRFEVNAVAATVHIAHRDDYKVRGNGAADDLIKGVLDAMDSHPAADTFSAGLLFQRDPAVKNIAITFDRLGAHTFRFLFANNATSFDAGLIGCSQVDGVAAVQQFSDLSSRAVWVGNDIYESLEPVSTWQRELARSYAGVVLAVNSADEIRDRLWVQKYIEERRFNEEAITADPYSAFNRFLQQCADGTRFEFHSADTFFSNDNGGEFDFTEDLELVGEFKFDKDFYPLGFERIDGGPLYSFSGHLLPYVAP